MSGRVLLINPARHFIANHYGVGYLIPLGLVSIGGPLIDAGFTVKLIDHDAYGWSLKKLIEEVRRATAQRILERLFPAGAPAKARTAVSGWLWFMDGACLNWIEHRDIEREELREKVLVALRSLPDEYRLPLALRYLAGADYDTIGEQLGLTNGSLRGLLHRGLKLLRDRLPPEFGG